MQESQVTVGYSGYDNLSPIIVESPIDGVDFSSCTPDDSAKYCCVDFVRILIETVQHKILLK